MVNDEVSSFFCSLPHSIGKILLQLFFALKRARQRIDVCGVVCEKTKIWHTNEIKKKEEEKNNTTGAFCQQRHQHIRPMLVVNMAIYPWAYASNTRQIYYSNQLDMLGKPRYILVTITQ